MQFLLSTYQGGLLHSKIMLIDNDFALFGTVNTDMRSFYLNTEVTLAIYRASDEFGQLKQ